MKKISEKIYGIFYRDPYFVFKTIEIYWRSYLNEYNTMTFPLFVKCSLSVLFPKRYYIIDDAVGDYFDVKKYQKIKVNNRPLVYTE